MAGPGVEQQPAAPAGKVHGAAATWPESMNC